MATTEGVIRLAELTGAAPGEFFARLAQRQRRTTRDGKPFFKVTFQDAQSHLSAMIWHDSPFFASCEKEWVKGENYRITARLSESKFGPQLDLQQVRPVGAEDLEDGFDPDQLIRSARRDPAEIFERLMDLARERIGEPALRELVAGLYEDHREDLLRWPAAARKHHAYPGGFLEHVLAVTETALFLADKYGPIYPEIGLSRELVVAGAMLHDLGKLIDLETTEEEGDYTPAGRLVGHLILGRDLLRDRAAAIEDFDDETLLRLEHIILAHQGRPEWGSPIAPATPEALLVHCADSIDAHFDILAGALSAAGQGDQAFTSSDNPLRRSFYRGRRVGGP